MSDQPELFTIGELARRTGLSVRTIRFWSDADVVPPTSRSRSDYRLYDAEAVARLDLVRTLRELGMDLATVKAVLRKQSTVAEVAAAHASALDVEIRTLKVRRAVLRSVAHRGSSIEEMRIMHKMAKLSAAERQQVIDDFVSKAFEGVGEDSPGTGIAQSMRQMPAELPEDPSPAQVDAWVELAELVSDTDFQARCRQMAVAGSQDSGPEVPLDHAKVSQVVTPEVVDDVAPESARGKEILAQLTSGELSGEQMRQLADQLDTFTDRRVERYWELMGTLNGWPTFPSRVSAFEWLIKALRAHGR